RGAIGVNPQTYAGWVCFQCNISGGPQDFLRLHTAAGGSPSLLLEPRPPSSFLPKPKEYPPTDEVQQMWEHCKDVHDDPASYHYLCNRFGRDVPRSHQLRDVVRGALADNT